MENKTIDQMYSEGSRKKARYLSFKKKQNTSDWNLCPIHK